MIDEGKLNAFLGKVVGDLGGAWSVPMVRLGDRLGLYRALKGAPMTAAELAATCEVGERYAREWLSHQAASGYVEYDPASEKFTLPEEQAMVFADPEQSRLHAAGLRSDTDNAGGRGARPICLSVG